MQIQFDSFILNFHSSKVNQPIEGFRLRGVLNYFDLNFVDSINVTLQSLSWNLIIHMYDVYNFLRTILFHQESFTVKKVEPGRRV